MRQRKDIKGRNLRVGEFQRNDGRYQYSKMINGKRKVIYSNDLKELRRKEIEFLHIINTESSDSFCIKYTLDEYAFYWFSKYAHIGRKERTVQIYKYYYKMYISDKLGNIHLNNISKNAVEMLLYNYAASGFQKGTIGIIYNVLKILLNSAVEERYISVNVARNIRIPDIIANQRSDIDVKQLQLLIDFIKEDSYYNKYIPLFTLLFSTGIRIGEACALTWDDIDFEKNIITINKTLFYMKINGRYVHCISSPKSESSNRCIPMSKGLHHALNEHKKTVNIRQTNNVIYIDLYGTKRIVPLNFVFTTSRHNPMTESTFRAIINGIVKKQNKLNTKKLSYFSPHQIRHTFTSLAYEAGIDIKLTSEILGHANSQITLNRYTHITNKKMKMELKKINKLYDGLDATTKNTTNEK